MAEISSPARVVYRPPCPCAIGRAVATPTARLTRPMTGWPRSRTHYYLWQEGRQGKRTRIGRMGLPPAFVRAKLRSDRSWRRCRHRKRLLNYVPVGFRPFSQSCQGRDRSSRRRWRFDQSFCATTSQHGNPRGLRLCRFFCFEIREIYFAFCVLFTIRAYKVPILCALFDSMNAEE